MPSENKPPLVRRGFVIVLSLTMLVLYLAVTLAIPNRQRSMRGTKSTQILQDLRMLDAAVDQYAMEPGKRSGENVNAQPADLAKLQFDSRSGERGFIESTLEPKPVMMSTSKSTVLPGGEALEMIRRSQVFRTLHNLSPAESPPEIKLPPTAQAIVAPSSKVTTPIISPHVIQHVWESDFLNHTLKVREADALNDILNKRPVLPNATESSK
ncbi:MAG: hypothetical protein RL088_40 [Verrucomicrobiota bacterium]|jgi:hypothetical protein